tara:strand:+ start:4884 stop:5885 length:1002 start_codon:yes stop_codon:yes gene_type:complete
MKKIAIIVILCLFTILSKSQCPVPTGLFITNITTINALANWIPVNGVDHYKIRYRVYGAASWLNLGNIGMTDSTRNIPQLQQSTTYEWGIMAYCDSTNQNGSNWSVSDTFTTTAFVPTPFNPIITSTLTSLECNTNSELHLRITQDANEPDIGTGTIISDGGFFNINSINSNDSVGYATMTTSFLNITTVLRAGIVLGQNYATINSYDSSGALIGFFTIENESTGVKVEVLGSPNDGNNYTSGYVSELYFTNLFVTPADPGELHFFADINSELGDQIYASDTSVIWCNSTQTNESNIKKQVIEKYDLLGRKNNNKFKIIKFSTGKVEKKIILE